ncbi:GNAT family N-acetyltransferase [Burkholderia pyrrocinia]|uniref:GNAT family N-acetyltransferase n=1 Tax=Burkholderia pyrrocinia TaxID=60550 RepID=UPI001BCFDECD|nr:GNAT family N-acetyltransferase [Burkholderia pyrrocinia]QVN18587.1 GNAT family N-acetyltransferase [Burkholderia pyrrocinia]
MNVTIREATLGDLSFIVQQYDEGVSGGHFSGQPHVSTSRMWQEWLTKRCMVRQCFRPDGTYFVEPVSITTLLAEENGKPVGLLLSSPETPPDTSSIEIYMLSVSKFARQRGVASSMIQFEEGRHVKGTSFYARCYRKSTWAINLFRKHGYRIERISLNLGMHYLKKP